MKNHIHPEKQKPPEEIVITIAVMLFINTKYM